MKQQDKKPMSGGARLTASGKSPVAVALDKDQKRIAQRAADLEGRSLANLFVFHGLEAAKRILMKNNIMP